MEGFIVFLFGVITASLPFLLIGLVFILVFAGVLFFGITLAKKMIKEKNETIEYCKKNGLSFEDTMMAGFPKECKNFKITKKGKQRDFYYVVSGIRDNVYFSVMNYKYSDNEPPRESTFLGMKVISRTGNRRHQKPDYYATLCFLSVDGLNMPHFFIRDESFIMDSLGKVFGGQDINFNDDPEFSKMFVLQGDNESEIRRFFNSKIRSSFVKFHQKGFVYEGVGKHLFVYTPNNYSKIEEKMRFFADSIKFVPALIPSDNETLL